MDLAASIHNVFWGLVFICVTICVVYMIEQARLTKVLKYQESKPVRDMKKLHRKEIEKKLMGMDDREFEIFLTTLFKSQGYDAKATKATGDGGKDIVIKNYKKYGTTYVEAKHWKDGNLVSRPILQKLIGACAIDGVNHAIIITTSGYTKECVMARDDCRFIHVELWYMDDIIEMILESEKCGKDKVNDDKSKIDNLVMVTDIKE